jgi:DNA end-binding protein Ku
MYYNDSFIVAPDENPKPYALLARAMEAADKVAIGTLVMRSKQYVAALRARDGVLIMSTLVFADEIVPTAAITELARVEAVEVSDREMIMAESLVDSLSAEFSPGKYRDTYREQLLDVITRKAAGEQIDAAPQAVPVAQVVDLMAALEASVKAAKEARARHPSVIPEPVEKPAKRAAAKPAKKAAPKSVAATASVAAAEAAPRRVRKSA